MRPGTSRLVACKGGAVRILLASDTLSYFGRLRFESAGSVADRSRLDQPVNKPSPYLTMYLEEHFYEKSVPLTRDHGRVSNPL